MREGWPRVYARQCVSSHEQIGVRAVISGRGVKSMNCASRRRWLLEVEPLEIDLLLRDAGTSTSACHPPNSQLKRASSSWLSGARPFKSHPDKIIGSMNLSACHLIPSNDCTITTLSQHQQIRRS